MPHVTCFRSIPILRTPRVRQLEGMFDVPPVEKSEVRWEATLPLEERDWQIGLIVGPSGCGKSTLARELFRESMIDGFNWPADQSIIDAFPPSMGIKEVVGLLSSVGFSSPPSWLRPFRVLSNGEQFRVTIARALAEKPDLAVIDEFTSVVDRTVARIGSAAIAKTIRRRGQKEQGRRLVAVSCHYDIIDWLQPDWVFDPAANEFQWRSLRGREQRGSIQDDGQGPRHGAGRPPVELEIARVHRKAWALFKQHHYLSNELSRAARCFVAFVVEGCEESSAIQAHTYNERPENPPRAAGPGRGLPLRDRTLRPAAFTAVIHRPDPGGGYWAEHRTVCLPDFQGVGIGNALSEFVAGMFVATGKRYCSRTSHPAMIGHRAGSRLWTMHRGVSFGARHSGQFAAFNRSAALHRLTAGFRFTGEPNYEAARRFGIIPGEAGAG
ncbi:MAG: ABC transporter ATP-binding protein [Deltaproteobacteria bacterium]